MNNLYHIISSSQAGDTSPSGIIDRRNPTAVTYNAKGFLEVIEGYILSPYPDSKGLPTVGIGWLLQGPQGQVTFNADIVR